jgi:nucleoside-diphosphate-sugar epimerase
MSEPGGPHRRTVLITGATGALGGAVVRAFARDDWTIRTMSRTPPGYGPAAAHPHVAGEIDDARALHRAMDGLSAVVHMAALLHVVDPGRALDEEYRRVNVHGTRAVMEAAVERGVRRVVGISSIAVYGPGDGLIDEDTLPAPETIYGRTKLEGERLVLGTVGVEGCALRLSAVYGPSIKGNYERLVHALARRRFVPVGDGQNRRTLVFEDDAANAIVLSASHPAAAGRTFNVTDGAVHAVRDIVAAICRALGRRPPCLAVPMPIAETGVRSAEAVCRALGRRSAVTLAALHKYVENVAVSGDRIRQTLGFAPSIDLETGWRQTVTTMRQEGRL